MSNELLMELFEYYDCYSLFFSFGSLNSRISNILYRCQVFVDLDRVQPIDFIDFFAHVLPQINPKNIRSLHASKSYQMMVLANDKSLIYFTSIRSISLIDIPLNVIEQMISRIHFSRLERVLIKKCGTEFLSTWSSFKHFLGSNRYNFLRTYKNCDSIIGKVTSVLLIEHLTTFSCTPCDFINILNQSPYLKYFRTNLNFKNQHLLPVFLSPIPCHHALTHLNLNWYGQVCMRTIDYLFQYLPRIRHLQLNVDMEHQAEYVEPIFWETFLRKHLGELKQLYLLAYTHDDSSSTNPIWNCLINKESIIEQIEKSNYWSSHQWKATFDSSIPTPSDDVYWADFKVD
jgi:hypothetical protein